MPVRGGTPVTAITESDQYTGTVSWSPNDSAFAASTTYTATITLTPKSGYTLTGVTANFFTVAGASTVSNSADSGVITAIFPATEAEPDTVVDIAAIGGVTAPVRGGTPVTAITESDQYTGTVSWSPNDSAFAANTTYTATITLTPEIGLYPDRRNCQPLYRGRRDQREQQRRFRRDHGNLPGNGSGTRHGCGYRGHRRRDPRPCEEERPSR